VEAKIRETELRVCSEWEAKLADAQGEWIVKVQEAERRAQEAERLVEAEREELKRVEREGEEERCRYDEMVESLKAGLQSEMDR